MSAEQSSVWNMAKSLLTFGKPQQIVQAQVDSKDVILTPKRLSIFAQRRAEAITVDDVYVNSWASINLP